MSHALTSIFSGEGRYYLKPTKGPFKSKEGRHRTILTTSDTKQGWMSIRKYEDEWSDASYNPEAQKNILKRHKMEHPKQYRIKHSEYKEAVKSHPRTKTMLTNG